MSLITVFSRQERSTLLTDTYIALSKSQDIWQGSLLQAMRHIVRACANALGAHRASIWQLNDAFTELTCLTLYREDTDQYEQGMSLDARTYPQYFAALANNRVIAAIDARNDTRTREFADTYLNPLNISSLLDASLRSQGKTSGVLCLENIGVQRIWSEDEQNFVASIGDLISQLILLDNLRDSESRYHALFDCSGDGIFVIRNGVFIECNRAILRMLGCSREEFIGALPEKYSTPQQPDGTDAREKAKQKIMHTLQGTTQTFEWRLQCIDDRTLDTEVTLNPVFLEDSACVIGTLRDISTRKQAELALQDSRRQLEYRANHDALTGLPNRDRLHEQAAVTIQQANNADTNIAFLLLDLNRFKEVNDTLGHTIGDHLLKQLATRLLETAEQHQAQLYRLGGDEFAVVATNINNAQMALDLAQSINNSLMRPIMVEGISLELGGSIGIALYPDHGNNSHAMLRCADVAMYHAKTRGTGIAIYDVKHDPHSPRRLMMMAELGTAIRENQLLLHYQPRIDLRSGKCTGCEALLRWQHPLHGMVPPSDFIPNAEMSEIIHPLSLWVVRNALEQIRRWLSQGKEIAVAINLSARNLTNLQCPSQIETLLNEYQIPHHLLEIEITESSLINDPKRAMQVLDELNRLGLLMAIDDFGTGYSSLSYLKRLPISTLKIDRSFVKDMLNNDADAVIVRSTIGLAHSFDLKVVAEGVEDSATLNALRQLQCDQAQGFYIAKPLPIDQFDHWFADLSSK